MPSISLPVHSYQLRAAQASTSRLVNCQLEQLPPDAKTPAVLTRSPGLASWTTVGTGPIEGIATDGFTLYVVSGGGFYTVTSAGVATLRGTVGSSAYIDMEITPTSVVIVSPPLAYHWTSPTFAQITDADFLARGAEEVEFLDGYLLFREPSSARFFSSDLNSVTAYTATMFATAEGSPDLLFGMKVDHRQIFLAGLNSIELWENTGQSGFPFERMVNGFIELGARQRTMAKIDNSILFAAYDDTVRRLDGVTPVRISTHAVEQWLRGVNPDAVRGYAYTLEGHLVYMLTAPEGAFFYDVTTQLWHERASYGSEPAWNWGSPLWFAAADKILVGSTTSNVIAELSPTTYDEVGSTLAMEWTYQPIYMEGKRVFHDKLELICDVGVGLTSGQGSSPEVMLDISDDAGRTWTAMPNKSLGALGRYATKITWVGLGSAYQRVYRFRVSDPVKVAVTDAVLTYRVGR